ncbi:hypothetical protein IG193_00790 [Infirmifilum lucidum]|uniref:Uncharacterized protein n=1 Tax=Infirmifilum lucidum TaxID=2776706 RepID=A0A7L9FJG3_9CREN|nr:hypothetical protein [Infirmifilum lucidum]QOJ79036.1 hypothetical protein IG193_00790 [Infirmifilum lucidum]
MGYMLIYRLADIAPDTPTLPRDPCVYAVLWFRGGRPVPIPRMLGVDYRGVLYVEATENLRRRVVSDLLRHLKAARSGGKPRANRHALVVVAEYFGLLDKIRDEELYITFKAYPDTLTAWRHGWAVLRTYAEHYGEPPPLNIYFDRKQLLVEPAEPDPELLEALGLRKANRGQALGVE